MRYEYLDDDAVEPFATPLAGSEAPHSPKCINSNLKPKTPWNRYRRYTFGSLLAQQSEHILHAKGENHPIGLPVSTDFVSAGGHDITKFHQAFTNLIVTLRKYSKSFVFFHLWPTNQLLVLYPPFSV